MPRSRRRGQSALYRLIDACNSGEVSSSRIAMCTSKIKYDTAEECLEGSSVRRAYECPHCGKWHGTNRRRWHDR